MIKSQVAHAGGFGAGCRFCRAGVVILNIKGDFLNNLIARLFCSAFHGTNELTTECLMEQQVRAFLEANGIPTFVRGEALRKTHAFVLDGLGEVQIQVSSDDAERARELIEAVENGALSLADDEAPESD